MVRIGYALSSEEHGPSALVDAAVAAEEAGFSFAAISDHFHPWIWAQGNSPFVWSVLGGIAARTRRLTVATGVTCPTIRIHPAIVAQAAATVTAMMPGRFVLGLGTGENLNEHVVGRRWPSASERLDMLEEAIHVIRELWGGETVEFRGRHVEVVDARLTTLPEEPPPILVASAGPRAAELAGRLADGIIATAPDRELTETYRAGGGTGPAWGQVALCWAEDGAQARRTARRWWPTAALGGDLGQELPLPDHFEQAIEDVSEDDVARSVVCGPDPEPILEQIRAFAEAGFDHVYLHQVGPDQEGFFRAFGRELLPRLEREGLASAA